MIRFTLDEDGFEAELGEQTITVAKPLPNIVAAMRALADFSVDAFRSQTFEGLPDIDKEDAAAFRKTLDEVAARR